MTIRKLIRIFVRDERGISAMEYGVLGVLIVGGIAAAVGTLNDDLGTAFKTIGDNLSGASSTPTPPTDPE